MLHLRAFVRGLPLDRRGSGARFSLPPAFTCIRGHSRSRRRRRCPDPEVAGGAALALRPPVFSYVNHYLHVFGFLHLLAFICPSGIYLHLFAWPYAVLSAVGSDAVAGVAPSTVVSSEARMIFSSLHVLALICVSGAGGIGWT